MFNRNAVIKVLFGVMVSATGAYAQITHLPTECSKYDNQPNFCQAFPECDYDQSTGQCDEGGSDIVVINCSSDNYRRSECQAGGPVQSVRLLHQDSHADCKLNSSFGIRGNAIFVDRGCRGSFEVVVGSRQPAGQTIKVNCSSDNYRKENCQVGVKILSVRLLRQDSNASCRLNSSFGSEGTSIWVSRGCRGLFEVTTNSIIRPL